MATKNEMLAYLAMQIAHEERRRRVFVAQGMDHAEVYARGVLNGLRDAYVMVLFNHQRRSQPELLGVLMDATESLTDAALEQAAAMWRGCDDIARVFNDVLRAEARAQVRS